MTKRRIVRSILSVFLSLVLIISGFLPGMPFVSTVHAESTTKTITPGTDDAKTGTGTMEISLTIKKTPAAGDFTFTPPTSLIYDGQAKAATVSTETEGMGEVTVEYYNGDTKLSGAPTAEGIYTVKVNVAEGDDYKAATGITDDSWQFTITPQTKSMTITLEIASASVKTAPTAKTLKYNGSAQELVTAGEAENGEIAYALGTDETTEPTSGWGTEIPMGTEAGNYYVWYRAGSTHGNTEARCIPITIAADTYSMTITLVIKSAQTITAEDVTVTYGDTDKSVSASVTDPATGGGAISYAVKEGSGDYIDVDATTGALTIKKVGTATVVVTAAETGTYVQATKEVTVTINKANAVAATVTANNHTYDGTDKPLVNVDNSTLVGGEMQYALGTETEATQPYTTSIPKETEVGTYYVWYRVLGDVNHKDVPAACIKAEIQKKTSSGGSTSGSSGGSTSGSGSSQASTVENYTVPVSNESTVNVSTKISNSTAVVNEITQSDIDKISAGNTVSGNTGSGGTVSGNTTSDNKTAVTIDMSGAKSEVTAVQLTKSSLEKLTQALKADNGIETLDIKLSGATVSFDKTALTALNDQSDGKNIKLVVTKTANTSLNDAQKEAVKNFTSVQPVKIYFESDGKELHDFKGGKASVSIKYTPEAGRDVKKYFVYYISKDGKLERFKTKYINGYFSFVTSHFSEYAIVYDENAADADTNTGSTDGSGLTGKALRYRNTLTINAKLKVSQTKSRINIKWGKVGDADGYDIYVQYCGKKFGDPVATIEGKTSAKIKTVNGEKLKLTKNFKVRVVAYKLTDGKKKVLCKTVVAHIVGRNNRKYSNPKKLTVKTKQLTLSAGETAKVKAKVVLCDPSKKSLTDKHAPTFRYASSDKSVAKVDKKGNITAKSAGTCYIYVYARNGFAKKIKVTVE